VIEDPSFGGIKARRVRGLTEAATASEAVRRMSSYRVTSRGTSVTDSIDTSGPSEEGPDAGE